MKKIILLLTLLILPIFSVNALECYDKVIDLRSSISSFECFNAESENITLKNKKTGEDVTSKFKVALKNDKKINIEILDRDIVFSKEFENGEIIISDGTNEDVILIKNYAYIAPSTTTTTTTTKDVNTKTFVVSLNPGNGKEIIEKKCEVNSNNTICSVTLPKLDDNNFNGWGTQSTCKEGKSGTIRVDKDITYYACYKNSTTQSTTTKASSTETTTVPNNENSDIYLKSLKVVDKDTNLDIDFGIFSIKKYEYEFKVLNEVKNLEIKTDVADGIKVEIVGSLILNEGVNKITIKLSDDNNTKEYVLNIDRLEEGKTLNDKYYLKSLVIGGFEDKINFNKEIFNYTLEVGSDINSLEIVAVPEDSEAKVDIVGKDNIKDGSLIKISVSKDDSESLIYSINITKEKSVNFIIIAAFGLIVVLVIILIILIIIKSNNKNKMKVDKNKKEEVEVLNI